MKFVGVLEDLAFKMVSHSRFLGIRERVIEARAIAVARGAAPAARNADVVIAAWQSAKEPFAASDAVRVLNYPLAHHEYCATILKEEMERVPAFAATMNSHSWPSVTTDRMNEEIETADRIVVGSHFAAESFPKTIGRDKFIISPYGHNNSLFRRPDSTPVNGRDLLHIVFVGQLTQRKGIYYFLETAKKLKGKARFTAIGAPVGTVEPLAKYQDVVTFVPFATSSVVAETLRTADIMLFPTLAEGMPISVLEAMACGVVPLTTMRGPGEIVEDGVNGFLFQPNDVEGFVSKIEELDRQRDQLAWMGTSASKFASAFTWKRFAEVIKVELEHA
ncbi:hypothetical protein MAE02_34600 [Microvirga aerophila]|uniref:Glycosyl transferase family 1 domain-containing protein n=1 Tax=Microvirga aerophila TaxID=670291 RepID=A0A512BUW9_9HYPH|nr:hypothetical protein MAE02_34600 [Microvirga aerophila]